MIGLIFIGLMGVGAVIFFTSQVRDQSALLPPTSTPLIPTFTPTPTDTPIPPTPTDTPEPTPTSTLVVSLGGQDAAAPPPQEATVDPQATPTNTLVLQTPSATEIPPTATAPPEIMPPGGGVLPLAENGPLIWVGVAMLVLLTLGIINNLKALD